MDIMIDFNDKSEREGTHELLKEAIKEAGEQIKVECPTGTLKALEKLIETQEKIIEEQEERIAIMSEGDTEAMLNKACETIANFNLDFVCDDNTLDDGWCNEHCKAAGQKPECFRHWLMKQTTEPPKEGDAE